MADATIGDVPAILTEFFGKREGDRLAGVVDMALQLAQARRELSERRQRAVAQPQMFRANIVSFGSGPRGHVMIEVTDEVYTELMEKRAAVYVHLPPF